MPKEKVDKIGNYVLKPASEDELPQRGKWKRLALKFIDRLDQTPEQYMKIENIETEEEYNSLYDALKKTVARNDLKVEVKRKTVDNKFVIYLLKDMRYFLK